MDVCIVIKYCLGQGKSLALFNLSRQRHTRSTIIISIIYLKVIYQKIIQNNNPL